MTPKEIAAAWRLHFGEAVPLGHVCRKGESDRWVRIHSLPASKRYPDDEADFRELLSRHNAVATAVLGEGEPCVLFFVTYDDDAATTGPTALPGVEAKLVPVPHLTFRPDDDPGNPLAKVKALETVWRRSAFDELLRGVAEDRLRVLFANLRFGTAYAPYEGGADVFVSSPEAVGPSRAAWRRWLSPRADGL